MRDHSADAPCKRAAARRARVIRNKRFSYKLTFKCARVCLGPIPFLRVCQGVLAGAVASIWLFDHIATVGRLCNYVASFGYAGVSIPSSSAGGRQMEGGG